MTFDKLIDKNIQRYGDWARYAYHYTDVTNAVNIVRQGKIFSRNKVLENGLMFNENAGTQIVNLNDTAHNYARLYFRPQTPTQFHNEGYKHSSLRIGKDGGANIPIPIFFLFDLKKLMANPNVKFVATGLAGTNPAALEDGEKNFGKLPFHDIYDSGAIYGDADNIRYIVSLRRAEIVIPDELELEPYLEKIVCRNEIERRTFLHLLYHDYSCYRISEKIYESVFSLGNEKNFINMTFSDTENEMKLFNRNGFFVDSFEYHQEYGIFTVKFFNAHSKREHYGYMRRYRKIDEDSLSLNVTIRFESSFSERAPKEYVNEVNYFDEYTYVNSVDLTRYSIVKIFVEGRLMCWSELKL